MLILNVHKYTKKYNPKNSNFPYCLQYQRWLHWTHTYTLYTHTHLSGGVRKGNENVRPDSNIKFIQQSLYHSVSSLIAAQIKMI